MDLPTLVNRANPFPVLGGFKFFVCLVVVVVLFVLGGGGLKTLIERAASKQGMPRSDAAFCGV